MNYAQLSAALAATMETDFPPASLPGGATYSAADQLALFFRQAESRIFDATRFAAMRQQRTLPAVTYSWLGSGVILLPPLTLAVESCQLVPASTARVSSLLQKDLSFLQEAFPVPASSPLTPRYYAVAVPPVQWQGGNTSLAVYVAPNPAATVTYSATLLIRPPSVVDVGTTWLSERFDTLLLAAAALEAALFLKLPKEALEPWGMRYQEALTIAKRYGDGLERTDAYRNVPARNQVG
jgi:hypothetical protein